MSGDALVIRGDARQLPLPDETVDLIVTSPPYWAQRSYKDGGEHYDGQLGSEETAQAFLDALWTVTTECWRVLKPTGSMFVNLGDKRAGSGSPGTTVGSTLQGTKQQLRTGADRAGTRVQYAPHGFGRKKSKMLLPHRYAIGCEDGLADPDGIGWIVRQDLVWSKPNMLPEPVRDRTRDTHEMWFHLTKSGDYYHGTDEIREPHTGNAHPRRKDGELPPKDARGVDTGVRNPGGYFGETTFNPLGRIPGSVWEIPSEPIRVPAHLGVEHFAAFPQEWPRRLILGWSPNAWCVRCGSPRRPVSELDSIEDRRGRVQGRDGDSITKAHGVDGRNGQRYSTTFRLSGYACDCDDTTAPTTPAVVLDPFAGTGTVPMVARALGRRGIGVELSADYARLARWRVFESGHAAKSIERRNREAQGSLL